MNRALWILVGVLLVAGAIVDGRAILKRRAAEREFQNQVELAKAESERIRAEVVLAQAKKMPRGENFAGALQQFGLSANEVTDATAAAQRAYNLRQLRAGNSMSVGRSVEGTLRQIDYKIDADRMLRITPEDKGYSAQIRDSGGGRR